jgi:uncharacterized protein (TIGR04562 family)
MRYLADKNLVSVPHNIADQSNNTLYPLNLFFEVMEGFTSHQKIDSDKVDELLLEKLKCSDERAEYKEKLNRFSSPSYRFIKFITRRNIVVPWTPSASSIVSSVHHRDNYIRFFYPFEVQIVDYQTYLKNISGPASHEKYKRRQRMSARARVFGVNPEENLSKEGVS